MLNPFLFLLREFWLAGLRLVCLRPLPSWPKAASKTYNKAVPHAGFLVAVFLYAAILCMVRSITPTDRANARYGRSLL